MSLRCQLVIRLRWGLTCRKSAWMGVRQEGRGARRMAASLRGFSPSEACCGVARRLVILWAICTTVCQEKQDEARQGPQLSLNFTHPLFGVQRASDKSTIPKHARILPFLQARGATCDVLKDCSTSDATRTKFCALCASTDAH